VDCSEKENKGVMEERGRNLIMKSNLNGPESIVDHWQICGRKIVIIFAGSRLPGPQYGARIQVADYCGASIEYRCFNQVNGRKDLASFRIIYLSLPLCVLIFPE
jgi:hypothetical protein